MYSQNHEAQNEYTKSYKQYSNSKSYQSSNQEYPTYKASASGQSASFQPSPTLYGAAGGPNPPGYVNYANGTSVPAKTGFQYPKSNHSTSFNQVHPKSGAPISSYGYRGGSYHHYTQHHHHHHPPAHHYKNSYKEPQFGKKIVKYNKATDDKPQIILDLRPKISIHRVNETHPERKHKHKEPFFKMKFNPYFVNDSDPWRKHLFFLI